MNKFQNLLKTIIFTLVLVSGVSIFQPIDASADYSISLTGINFDNHRSMKATIDGKPVFCIQYGYPFRSKVSDLQMVNGSVRGHEGTIADNVRYLLFYTDKDWKSEYFRGWGSWSTNGDATDAVQTSTAGAPTSLTWNEDFDDHASHSEDAPYNNRVTSSGGVTRWLSEVYPNMTGHEGSVAPTATQMKKITYAQAGFSTSQVYAQAMTNYYIYEDSDASGYSSDTKFKCKQAVDWCIEKNKITTIGIYGTTLNLIFQNNCDGYVKEFIGSQYDAMKLYRQMVWKTTNMRMIPSFASRVSSDCEPIKLYWDENIKKYTATVSDANGVLNYFDFNIPGCTVTNNGDGTLTITSANQLDGVLTSSPNKSRLEPSDGIFKLPQYFRWNLEGKVVSFSYTALQQDFDSTATAGGGSQIFYESGDGRAETRNRPYVHSHSYSPACNWFCGTSKEEVTHCTKEINNCTETPNAGWVEGKYTKHKHSFAECGAASLGRPTCKHNLNAGWVAAHYTRHEHTDDCHTHTIECQHQYDCPYWQKYNRVGYDTYVNSSPLSTCRVTWCCGKQHFKTVQHNNEISGKYIDWQDLSGVYTGGQKLVDPVSCYIKVQTVPHEYKAETNTDVLLIAANDEWNDLTYTLANGETIKHASHIRIGEKYSLKYIYTYEGASKGFRIDISNQSKAYYKYTYMSRMYAPNNTTSIYNLRNSARSGNTNVPHASLVLDKTPITIYGSYSTAETAYPNKGVYSWNSGSNWNDNVYLDALTTDQYDDNYSNKSASEIINSHTNSNVKSFKVAKNNNKIQVIWIYETPQEVFTTPTVNANAYIQIGTNKNYTKTYYDEAYNYAKDDDHNYVGGIGYFSSSNIGAQVPSHTVYTQNNEYETYAIENKLWQADVEIKVSNFVQNTGAGITQQTYEDVGNATHRINYNLYYTIKLENPKATITWDKIRKHNNLATENKNDTNTFNTSSEVNEFDINTLISWGTSGGNINTNGATGSTKVVDHIKTGTTYLQRTVPVVLNTLESGSNAAMTMKIYPNYDRLIYEDSYTGVRKTGSIFSTRYQVTYKDSHYPDNEKSATSTIYKAMNPNNTLMRPSNILSSGNIPNTRDDEHKTYGTNGASGKTTFNIKLSDGTTKTVSDSNTKSYTQYNFTFNNSLRSNKVTFGSHRKSITFFKYSHTNYGYNGKTIQSITSNYANNNKSQTESYYISQVLFKSNYTTKYQKELEKQGANYIVDTLSNGEKEPWIDMVNQNKFAIVAAGQGFELKVTVKYENSFLTQYLARYFGQNDAQSSIDKGSSYSNNKYLGPQYCNISSMTGFINNDGKAHAYINGINTIDRLAVNLVTGSNVYKDLYCYMSDNPDTVYTYSGIYNTPVIFDRKVSYSKDFSTTTITYTMSKSVENGVSSSFQNMKFYTNQLAPDVKTPGIVEGSYDVKAKGEHSVIIWTPIVAATPFDYPHTIQDRYIGDAIELGYTIKSTGADDSIVHIVQ